MSAWIVLSVMASALGAAQQPDLEPARTVTEVHVDVGGRTVRALCTDGPRRVLFLHGADHGVEGWRPVLERLGPDAGACAYDRGPLADLAAGARAPRADFAASASDRRGFAGPGAVVTAADDAPGRTAEARGWFELVEVLREVHAALGFDRPAVLVGHGIGGMYARLLAADRPGDVAGLVLVEPAHEDLPGLLLPAMPRPDWQSWMDRRSRPNADGVRETALAERARRARLPDIPVTVVTATLRAVEEGWDPRFVDEAARQAHEEIVQGLEDGRHVPAHGTARDLPVQSPALLADEIERVIRIAGMS